MVSRKLDSLLRAHVASSRGVNAFSSSAGGEFGRPLLVILDRNVDLVPMLSHSWTYQALVNDVLGMKLNRVTVEVRFVSFPCLLTRSSLSPSQNERVDGCL
jgi:hypothetical protein